MEVVDSVSPLRRPTIAREQLLEPECRVRTWPVQLTAIKQYGKTFVVRHPAATRQAQHFRILYSSPSTSLDGLIGSMAHSWRRSETQKAERTPESSSVHECHPFEE